MKSFLSSSRIQDLAHTDCSDDEAGFAAAAAEAEAEAEEAAAAVLGSPPQGTGAVNPGSHLGTLVQKVGWA